jgi:Uma2 family endonuclease
MTTVATPVTHRLILCGIHWHTYQQLATDLGEQPVRLAYDQGTLEIMTPSFEHERLNRLLADIVQAIAFGKNLAIEHAGSTDFQREDVARGFQPDSCFYLGDNVQVIHGKTRLDVSSDPPPDLVVEVDVTHRSLNKLPLYAAIGVPEVWRFDSAHIILYRLSGEAYQEVPTSAVFEGVTADVLLHFVQLAYEIPRKDWFFHIMQWAEGSSALGSA